RQVDLDARPQTELAVHPDEAAAPLHDAVYRRQPDAGPGIRVFGREVRLEQVRLRLRRHPGAGIAHGEQHVLAGRHRALVCHVALVELDVLRFDGDPATPRHRVARVQHQVEQYLLELAWIRLDAGGARLERARYRDPFAGQAGP